MAEPTDETSNICLDCTLRRARRQPPKVCNACPTLQPTPLYARKERAVEALFAADVEDQRKARANEARRSAPAATVKDELPKRGRPRVNPAATQAELRKAATRAKAAQAAAELPEQEPMDFEPYRDVPISPEAA